MGRVWTQAEAEERARETSPFLYEVPYRLQSFRAVDEDIFEVTIYANAVARDGINLHLDGLDRTNYDKNRVVLFAHNSRELPIGESLEIIEKDEKLRSRFRFLDSHQKARDVAASWREGGIGAASLSWIPGEWTIDDDGVLHDITSEMIEWSIVSVPADPDALRAMAVARSRLFGVDAPGIATPAHGGVGTFDPEWVEQMIAQADGDNALTRYIRQVVSESNQALEPEIGSADMALLNDLLATTLGNLNPDGE